MYAFCLSFPYGFLLMMGGFMGFIKRGSVGSLVGGCVGGAVVLLCAQREMHEYQQLSDFDELDKFDRSNIWVAISAAISCLLTFVMGLRYKKSGKTMPLIVANVSGAMFLFYSHYTDKLLQGFLPLGLAVAGVTLMKVESTAVAASDSKKSE